MNDKKNVFYGVVGLILVAAIIISAFVYYNYFDASNVPVDTSASGDTSETGGATEVTAAPSSTNSVNGVTYPEFYVKGNLGYVTKDNVTTFFVVVNQFEQKNPSKYDDTTIGCYDGIMNVIVKATPAIYNNTEYYPSISVDVGETWQGLTYSDYYQGYYTKDIEGMYTDEIYLAYTRVNNCSNPIYYLEQIQLYSFSEAVERECSGCSGTYMSYADFLYACEHISVKG